MISKKILAAASGLAAIGIAFATSQKAGIGMALGIGGATFNLWAIWLMTGALGRLMKDPSEDFKIETKKAKIASVLIVLAFFSKLPIFLSFAIITRRVGPPALTCFLVGVGLVYFALIGWTLAKSYGPP